MPVRRSPGLRLGQPGSWTGSITASNKSGSDSAAPPPRLSEGGAACADAGLKTTAAAAKDKEGDGIETISFAEGDLIATAKDLEATVKDLTATAKGRTGCAGAASRSLES